MESKKEQGLTIAPKAMADLDAVVQRVMREIRNNRPPAAGRIKTGTRNLIVKLDEDLGAGSTIAATKAVASVQAINATGELYDTQEKVTISNRFSDVTIVEDTVTKVEWVHGEWQPYAGSGAGTGGGDCPCTCLDAGNITLDGAETTATWTVTTPAIKESQEHGIVTLPAADYVLIWDQTQLFWWTDISDDLTAVFYDGSGATELSSLSGTLTFRKSDEEFTTLKLVIDATIPEPQ